MFPWRKCTSMLLCYNFSWNNLFLEMFYVRNNCKTSKLFFNCLHNITDTKQSKLNIYRLKMRKYVSYIHILLTHFGYHFHLWIPVLQRKNISNGYKKHILELFNFYYMCLTKSNISKIWFWQCLKEWKK